jgi:hypothetical protein
LNAGEPQTVPPRAEFSLLYMIPSMLDDRESGIPADQFRQAFGDLYFTFRYDTNQMFAPLVSVPEIEQQLSRIEREAASPLPAPARRAPWDVAAVRHSQAMPPVARMDRSMLY